MDFPSNLTPVTEEGIYVMSTSVVHLNVKVYCHIFPGCRGEEYFVFCLLDRLELFFYFYYLFLEGRGEK